jgi:tetratricopeptide (TPR) repeat protein
MPQPIIRALALPALASALALTGCAGQGKHTAAFKEKAQQRMSALSAATNWDMAHQQFLAGDLDKALKTIEQSLSLHDGVAKSHLLHGRILLELDRLAPALEALDRATGLDGALAEPHYYSGIVQERLSKHERALEAYNAAADIDPANPQYLLAAAEMLIHLGRLDEAEQRLASALSTFEHNPGIRQTRGHIAMMRSEHERAVHHFSEACLLGPDDPGLLDDLARAQIAVGDFDEATFTLERLIDNAKAPAMGSRQLLAHCYMELDRPVQARDLLIELTQNEQAASDVSVWLALGKVCIKLGDRFRLRQAASRVIAVDPENVEGYLLMAWWLKLNEQPERAIATLEQAKSRTGNVSDPSILQGLIYRDLGERERARDAVALALAADPSDTRAMRLSRALEGPLTASAPLD